MSRKRTGSKRTSARYSIIALPILAIVALILLATSTGLWGGRQGAPLQILSTMDSSADLKNLTVITIDGEKITLGNTSGKPMVILAIATWCATCAAAAVTTSEAIKSSGVSASVIVIGIWSGALIRELGLSELQAPPPDTPDRIRSFIARFGDPSWKIVLDDNATLIKALRLRYIDGIIVLNSRGEEIFRKEPGGYASIGEVANALKRASGLG